MTIPLETTNEDDEMTRDGQKWPDMIRDARRWPKMTYIPEITGYMIGDDGIWSEMTEDDHT